LKNVYAEARLCGCAGRLVRVARFVDAASGLTGQVITIWWPRSSAVRSGHYRASIPLADVGLEADRVFGIDQGVSIDDVPDLRGKLKERESHFIEQGSGQERCEVCFGLFLGFAFLRWHCGLGLGTLGSRQCCAVDAGYSTHALKLAPLSPELVH
jgi:hypothetical protein